ARVHAAARAGQVHPGARHPHDADREEARGPRPQAADGRAAGEGRQHKRDGRPVLPGRVHRLCAHAERLQNVTFLNQGLPMTEQAGFPLPSQIEDVPGAENWRSMYQYFTRFQPEDDKRFWFYNSMHFPEPMPAFDTITGEVPYQAIGANTARLFVFPTTLGIEHRIVNGRVYITANPVLDPAEMERRAAEFGPRAGYYFENWDSLYEGWKDRVRALIAEIE